MNTTPMTTEEWVDYILDAIPSEDLVHQARVCGSNPFIRMMKEEGYDASALLAIHYAFLARFVREDLRIPAQMDGCHVNYNEMALNPDSELQALIAKVSLPQEG